MQDSVMIWQWAKRKQFTSMGAKMNNIPIECQSGQNRRQRAPKGKKYKIGAKTWIIMPRRLHKIREFEFEKLLILLPVAY